MAILLHPHFLDDASEYRKVQQLWKNVVDQTLAPHDYHYQSYVLEKPEMTDGHPVFNGLVLDRQRALRIIQYRPDQGAPYIATTTDRVEQDGELPFDELLIEVILTDDLLKLACELIYVWFVEELSGPQFDLRAEQLFLEEEEE